jgi:hypothetical protein
MADEGDGSNGRPASVLPDGIDPTDTGLTPPPQMGPWKLACVVQVVNFRRRNGATPTVSPHDMNKRTGETIPEFLERRVGLMLQQPYHDLAKHLICAQRTDDIQPAAHAQHVPCYLHPT